MNIIINFRYLNSFELNHDIIEQVSESKQLKAMIRGFKKLSLEYKESNITLEDIENNSDILDKLRYDVTKNINTQLNKFNDIVDYDSYLWLDELCCVSIRGSKATPLENQNEYVNFNDLKSTVERAINELALKKYNFDKNNYSDIVIVIYIDIITKFVPISITYI